MLTNVHFAQNTLRNIGQYFLVFARLPNNRDFITVGQILCLIYNYIYVIIYK